MRMLGKNHGLPLPGRSLQQDQGQVCGGGGPPTDGGSDKGEWGKKRTDTYSIHAGHGGQQVSVDWSQGRL